ncbi:MAG: GDP-mannose 4,6-dehydratase, partial [Promethearchaeota archaeon]
SRMFTHTGPRRGEVFVVSAFAKQVAMIELGLQEPSLKVGNLKSVRTFLDVRDAVRAYYLLVKKCRPGEVYNIGGNRTMEVGEMLDLILKFSPMKEKIKIKVSENLLRPSDVTLQIPDISKFVSETNWKPEIPLEKTLEDTLNYWRERLKTHAP